MQFQTVYLWHDPRLEAVKIGKTNNWERFYPQRIWSALSANPTIEFIGAWESNLPPGNGDAGEFAAQPFSRLLFESGAKEWFRTDPGSAAERLEELWGKPRLAALPAEVLTRKAGPYDIFGSSPDRSGKSYSRLWLYKERQENGFLRLADSAWWGQARDLNSGSMKSLTFAPKGMSTIAGFEWQSGEKTPSLWGELNTRLRVLKNRISDELAPDFISPVARCGWIETTLVEIEDRLSEEGLARFDIDGPIPLGTREKRSRR
tara:strand:- start:8038 stop:8820 length:783 start_codon:yes stop_codon:yes gene_type:complete